MKANRQRALYVPFISWVPLLAQAAVLLVGARMVTSGELTVGGFVAFNLYLGMLVMPLRSLGMWIGQAQRATASGERIFQVMDEPEEIADRPGAVELPAGRRATCASRTCASSTSPGGRCSTASTSSRRPAGRSR